jgi:hypothetical protein
VVCAFTATSVYLVLNAAKNKIKVLLLTSSVDSYTEFIIKIRKLNVAPENVPMRHFALLYTFYATDIRTSYSGTKNKVSEGSRGIIKT